MLLISKYERPRKAAVNTAKGIVDISPLISVVHIVASSEIKAVTHKAAFVKSVLTSLNSLATFFICFSSDMRQLYNLIG